MDLVVDSSAIIAVITNELHRQRLVEATEGAELIAPTTLHAEIGNAFSAMLKRRRMTLDTALRADSDELGRRFRFKLDSDSAAKWYGGGVKALEWVAS